MPATPLVGTTVNSTRVPDTSCAILAPSSSAHLAGSLLSMAIRNRILRVVATTGGVCKRLGLEYMLFPCSFEGCFRGDVQNGVATIHRLRRVVYVSGIRVDRQPATDCVIAITVA